LAYGLEEGLCDPRYTFARALRFSFVLSVVDALKVLLGPPCMKGFLGTDEMKLMLTGDTRGKHKGNLNPRDEMEASPPLGWRS